MFKKLAISTVAAITFATGAMAAGEAAHIENIDFSFDGPFGTYDQNQLQRGLQIYTEICSSCHGLKYVPIRTLSDDGGPHLPKDQVRAYADQFVVYDELANPKLFDVATEEYRALTPADSFPINNSQAAPDLSLMAKSRAAFHGPYGLGINQLMKGTGGAEYIAALMQGYVDAPSCTPEDMSGSYNKYFTTGGYPVECMDENGKHKYPGSWIAMSQPLYGEDIEFADGHANDLHHASEDIAAFLMWAAEPKLQARKQSGFVGVLLLTLLSVLLYLTNKRLWAPHKKKKH